MEINKFSSGMQWYVMTEMCHDILNSIMVRYSVLLMKEEEKESPDETFITEITKKRNIVRDLVFRDSTTYNSLERMQELIGEYLPVYKELFSFRKIKTNE
jgi:hypothetical protein